MNLHSIVSGAIGTVNPLVPVSIRVSTGSVTNPDGTRVPGYATPGSITASVGGSFTAAVVGLSLVVSAVLAGSLWPGDTVTGTDGVNAIPPGTTIVSQSSGATGGDGTYVLSQVATVGACTVTAVSDVLNVTAVGAGTVQTGQDLSDVTSALLAGTNITGPLSGTGAAGTYQLNQPQLVAVETMTTALGLLAQVQPMSWKDLRQTEGLNLQGTMKSIYLNGTVSGVVRVALKGGDLVTLPDGSDWLVTTVLEDFSSTAGWTKAVMTLQNQRG